MEKELSGSRDVLHTLLVIVKVSIKNATIGHPMFIQPPASCFSTAIYKLHYNTYN
jgi:hypothetical protein